MSLLLGASYEKIEYDFPVHFFKNSDGYAF